MKIKILVLLATYNGLPWLNSQIDSILNQDNLDISLFISDDDSTDGTLEFIKHLSGMEMGKRIDLKEGDEEGF
jgi:rhamnosyltransferase